VVEGFLSLEELLSLNVDGEEVRTMMKNKVDGTRIIGPESGGVF
jgi:hypothetical protein